MSWKAAIRSTARRNRIEHGFALDALVYASTITESLAAKTGISVSPLRHGDPLLSGAWAVLDRDNEIIWSDESLSVETRAYHAVHEYGHLV